MLAIIGHGIAELPCRLMAVQPSQRPAAADFAAQKVDPMIRANPVLAELVAGKRQKGASNAVDRKLWPGGSLTIAGANSSPLGLALKAVEKLLADEGRQVAYRGRCEGR